MKPEHFLFCSSLLMVFPMMDYQNMGWFVTVEQTHRSITKMWGFEGKKLINSIFCALGRGACKRSGKDGCEVPLATKPKCADQCWWYCHIPQLYQGAKGYFPWHLKVFKMYNASIHNCSDESSLVKWHSSSMLTFAFSHLQGSTIWQLSGGN